jgi:hypothetical protein
MRRHSCLVQFPSTRIHLAKWQMQSTKQQQMLQQCSLRRLLWLLPQDSPRVRTALGWHSNGHSRKLSNIFSKDRARQA